MSVWRNDIKCKYMLMFPLKNLACKELIFDLVLHISPTQPFENASGLGIFISRFPLCFPDLVWLSWDVIMAKKGNMAMTMVAPFWFFVSTKILYKIVLKMSCVTRQMSYHYAFFSYSWGNYNCIILWSHRLVAHWKGNVKFEEISYLAYQKLLKYQNSIKMTFFTGAYGREK